MSINNKLKQIICVLIVMMVFATIATGDDSNGKVKKTPLKFGGPMYPPPDYIHDSVPPGWDVWICDQHNLPCTVTEYMLNSNDQLWVLGNDSKVARLDGKWTRFDMNNTNGYIGDPEHPVTSIAEYPAGMMLFAIPSRELIVQYKMGIWSESPISKDFKRAHTTSPVPKGLKIIRMRYIDSIMESKHGLLITTKDNALIYKNILGYKKIINSYRKPPSMMRYGRRYATPILETNMNHWRWFSDIEGDFLPPDTEDFDKYNAKYPPIFTDRFNTGGTEQGSDGIYRGITSLAFEGAYYEAPTREYPEHYPLLYEWKKKTVYGRYTPPNRTPLAMLHIPTLPGMGIIATLFALLFTFIVIRRK